MKNSLKFFAVFCLVMVQTAFAQNINLKFTGFTTDGNYVQLDSVRVENLNRSWTETLVYPDTVLMLTDETGISELEGNSLKCLAYPNPCNGKTNVFLTLAQDEIVTMQMYNLAGQCMMEKQVQAKVGENHFEINLDHPQAYFLVTRTSHDKFVQKLINTGHSGSNSIAYLGIQKIVPAKVQKLLSTKPFHIGDVLRMTGYVTHNGNIVNSNEILQSQAASENFTLSFTLQNATLPILMTDSVNNITDTSAACGGNVTNDGGTTIIARGVCWDTIHNPTINSSHTTDGSGTGSFTSNMTGLTTSTTYYVRAYATNAVGTAYGNEVVFTTTTKINYAVFSVSATDSVVFSPGNLQWSATNGGNTATTHAVAGNGTAAGTWRFAPNQWDTIGANNSNISSTYTGWIDLFGWGTSGFDQKYPYKTSTSSSTYGNGNSSLSGTYYDWGVYNTIYNPKTRTTDAPGTWRTLTKNEWAYLVNTRVTSSGIRYAKANVYGVNGLIIVPDNWSSSTYALDSINTKTATWMSNVINANDWSKMEAVGCVFLPAAGDRSGTSVGYVGSSCAHWSATDDTSEGAYTISFSVQSLYIGGVVRRAGRSVRLVRDVH